MKDIQHPAGPAFDRASEPLQAWREQQKAALNAAERARYERIARESEKKRRETIRQFWEERHEAIEAEKRAIMLPKPGPALRLGPWRPIRESRAEFLASELVHRRHGLLLEGLAAESQRQLDSFLLDHQHKREAQMRGIKREANEDAPDPKHTLSPEFAAALRARAKQRERGDDGRER
jgi:hypothetical protein